MSEGGKVENLRLFTVIDDEKPTTTPGEEIRRTGDNGHSHRHRYANVAIATAEQPHPLVAMSTVSRLSPLRGNKKAVQPYSSVTIVTNFGIPMTRNEAYGSRERVTTANGDSNDAITKSEDDDYDDIL